MAFYGIALALANLVGFGLSGVLASRLGYNAVFFLGGGLLCAGVILSLFLPGSRQTGGIADTPALPAFQQVKILLRRRGIIVSYCSIFAHYFTFGGVVTLLPIYLKSLGMEAFHVGILLAIFSVLFIAVQFPVGRLSDKVGHIKTAVTGLCLGIVSLVVLPLINAFPLLIAAMSLYGVAFGFLFPSASSLVAENTSLKERGIATGIFHALLTTGVAAGAPVIGWLGGWLGVQQGMMLIPVVLGLAVLASLITVKRS
jgi:MFS family permease